jgi:plasmid stabilization system protein ParE
MASEYKVRLTQTAAAQLDDIVGYLATNLANPPAASHFLDLVKKAMEEARMFPESGPRVINPFLPDGTVRKKILGNYVMYYRPDPPSEVIHVLAIVSGRRDIQEILRELSLE